MSRRTLVEKKKEIRQLIETQVCKFYSLKNNKILKTKILDGDPEMS